jgi:hypothetical protein
MGEKQMRPKHQTLALSPCLGRMEMLRFIWNCLRPFGFIVVEGDPRPMTQKSRPGQGSRNSERKAKGIMSRENATEEKTSDFRRRTSAGSGGCCMRRPRGARVVASRGLELEVTIRGSGTPAASTFARHCEATRVSLPRKGHVHENARGQSPRRLFLTQSRRAAEVRVKTRTGTVPAEFLIAKEEEDGAEFS